MITFIIPAYNVENTIIRTLDSIKNQTSNNWKAIVVDDGSTDSTAGMVCEYISDDLDNFEYVYQANRGLGGARNTGISLILESVLTGGKYKDTEYISFLDSDDWLMSEYVETVSRYADNRKVDIILTLPVIWDETSDEYSDWKDQELFGQLFLDDGRVIIPSEELDVFDLEVNACRKVLSIEFINRIGFRFRENIKWEDVVPHYELLTKCDSVLGISSVGFYYRKGSASQITNTRGRDRLDIIPVLTELLDYAGNCSFGKDISFSIMRTVVRFSIWCIRMSDQPYRTQLVRELHRMYLNIPNRYFRALSTGARKRYSRKDALQYELVMIGIKYRIFNPIFYSDRIQKISEVVVRTLLHAGKTVK